MSDENSENGQEEGAIDERLANIIHFASQDKVVFLVEKSRFLRVPERVRTFSNNANEQLLQMLGVGFNSVSGTAYVYADEKLVGYGQKLISDIPEYKNFKLMQVICSAALFLVYAKKLKTERLIIDGNTPYEVELSSGEIEHLDSLASICTIAKIPNLYILQNKKVAMTMELDEKIYAVGFLSKELGKQTLEGFKKDNPGCSLGANSPHRLSENFLQSDLDGIVFNPASSSQTVISRDKLQLLSVACQVVGKPSVKSKFGKFFKS